MEAVHELCNLLQSHADRDKVTCLTSYVLKLWGATSNRQSLLTASARIAGARATLRLFDDAAALKAFLSYGLGKQDGPVWGSLGVAACTLQLLYLQAEKFMWLADCGLLKLSPETDFKVRTAHKALWSLASFIGLVRSIRVLHSSSQELNSPSPRKCAAARFTQASLVTTKGIFDVLHTISWLPPGCLWGGRLSTAQMGGVATISASLALIVHYHGKRLTAAR